jgi:sensor domain CHASE-containing protein
MTIPPRIIAPVVVLATMALMAGSVVVVKKQSAAAHMVRAASIAESARAAIQQVLDDHIDGLTTFSRAIEELPPHDENDYRDAVVQTAVQVPAFSAINYLDHRFVETYVYPYAANIPVLGLDLKTRADALPAAYRSVATRRPAATDLVILAQGGEGFLTYVPVRRRDRWEGLVEGALDVDAFVQKYVAPIMPKGHDAVLLDETGAEPFYISAAARPIPSGPFDYTFTVRLADRRWWGILHPISPPMTLWGLVLLMLVEIGAAALAIRAFIKRS